MDSSSSRQITVIQWFNPCFVSTHVTSAFSQPYTCNATRAEWDPINRCDQASVYPITYGAQSQQGGLSVFSVT